MRLSFDDGSRRRNFSALRNVATPQYCRWTYISNLIYFNFSALRNVATPQYCR